MTRRRGMTFLLRWLCCLFILSTPALAEDQRTGQRPADARPSPQVILLHLPGIGGRVGPDRLYTRALEAAGFAQAVSVYDWTGARRGLQALIDRPRNEREAAKVGRMIEDLRRGSPDAKIFISCHSGGAGIAAWALEGLPDGVNVDGVLLLSPALSPKYDLSKALSHVTGKAWVFTSTNDQLVLGAGTRMLGTIDRVHEEAAGLRGFLKPDGADDGQYKKLVQIPYTSEWTVYGNIGDHIGSLAGAFAEKVLSPLLLKGEVPVVEAKLPAPTTRPSETAQGARRDERSNATSN
jgi:hypothetical protein